MSLQVERTAADLSAIPANFKQHLDPFAPLQLKMMAAKAMLPLPPDQTVAILYTLALDEDQGVKEAAIKSMKDIPLDIFAPVVAGLKHVGILDWIADWRPDDGTLEPLVINAATAGVTVARLARRASQKICEIIATNQVRLLAVPAIIEQLYMNPNARAATVDRVVEMAHRSGIQLSGVPALNAALESGQDIFSGGLAEDAFDEIITQDSKRTRAHDEEIKEEDIDEVAGTMASRINSMSISQKVRLATVGSREAMHILVRDSNRLVHKAAVENPRVQYTDAKLWAGNKSMPDAVIAYIAANRDWTRHYDVQKALVENPKTPLGDTLTFLNFLRTNDLKQLQTNRNVPSQVSRQAKTLYVKRTSGQKR